MTLIDDVLRAHGVGGAQGNAQPAEVLTGYTFSNIGGLRHGSMPNNGALGTITPTTTNQTIPAGYTSGGTVAGDTNLTASNIKNGASIFGVTGSYVGYANGTGSFNGATNAVLTVSGLSFQPSKLLMTGDPAGSATAYNSIVNPTAYYVGITSYTATFTPNGSGFTLTITGYPTTMSVDWLALP